MIFIIILIGFNWDFEFEKFWKLNLENKRIFRWSGTAKTARLELRRAFSVQFARTKRQTGPARLAIFAIQLETQWRDVEEEATQPTGGMFPKDLFVCKKCGKKAWFILFEQSFSFVETCENNIFFS